MSSTNNTNNQKLSSVQQQATEWFVRLSNNSVSDKEKRKFEQWLSVDPQNLKEYQSVQGVWRELDGLKDTIAVSNINPDKRPYAKPTFKHLALAATLVFFLLGGMLTILHYPGSYQTAKGEQRTVHLADDSVVRLNSDTLLKVDLTAKQRTIHLSKGEAYFEVSHDPSRPFVVVTDGGTTRAVGTQFDVYREASGIRVAVAKGRVEVATNNGDSQLLNPDEMIVYGTNGRIITPVERQNSSVLDWLDGRLHFEATPLTEVVAQLNRYRETPLRIADPRLNNLKLSGAFRISNLKTFPELLPRMLPVSLKLSDDGALLLHPK